MHHPPSDHPVWKLIEELKTFEPPKDVCWVRPEDRTHHATFFPGGFGLWRSPDDIAPFPVRPIVVIGNNWGTAQMHAEARNRHPEDPIDISDPTSRNCLQILKGAGIALSQCFFTNAYMELLKGKSMLKRSPALDDPAYVTRCRHFLRFQLQKLCPSIAIVMGAKAIRQFSLMENGPRAWRGAGGGERSIKEIHELGFAIVRPIDLGENTPSFTAVGFCHPCDRRNSSKGFVKESELVRKAVETQEAASSMSIQSKMMF
ncbi:MAG TPA: hypothetical protein VFE58_14630 [Tepidisphaeraceae bacterium]|nr:hypothetical protein [Tepidisphaeraceae bacterium]